jgi:hypothetical protein
MSPKFKPTCWMLGSRGTPSSIVIYAASGGEDTMKVPVDWSSPPISWPRQAVSYLRDKPITPFFGRLTGFAIQHTSTHFVKFDLYGHPLSIHTGTYSPGQPYLLVEGENLTYQDFLDIIMRTSRGAEQ